MVVSLGPGKFYGSSLPRPRIYTDVKLNPDRVDPPVPVMDPLLSWAQEAHWSMGGLSFKRLRLQGRIEGNVNRLRKFREKQIKNSPKTYPKKDSVASEVDCGNGNNKKKIVRSDSPPPAPKVVKRRRFMDLFNEESEDEEEEMEAEEVGKKRPARRLVGDFDRVAKESEVKNKIIGGGVGDVVMKVVEEVNRENGGEGKRVKGGKKGRSGGGGDGENGTRNSPRLATKQRS